jgi:hypothetical protein
MPSGARKAWKATMFTTTGARIATARGTIRFDSSSTPAKTSVPLSSGKK